MNIGRPFGLRGAASCCLDATSFGLKEQGGTVHNYIDDLGGVASDEQTAAQHFVILLSLLQHLGLKEALYKSSAPAQAMTWLGPCFNTMDTIRQENMQDTLHLVEEWDTRRSANIHQLWALLGKRLHIVQCCSSGRLFLNWMLATLSDFPETGTISLT